MTTSQKIGAGVGRICYPTGRRLAKPPYSRHPSLNIEKIRMRVVSPDNWLASKVSSCFENRTPGKSECHSDLHFRPWWCVSTHDNFSKNWGGCRSDLLSDRTAVSKTALQSSSPLGQSHLSHSLGLDRQIQALATGFGNPAGAKRAFRCPKVCPTL